MWLTFDKSEDYELWDQKPNFNAKNDEMFRNKQGVNSPIWVFCSEEFEEAFPRLKLRIGEIRRIKVVPVGRKEQARDES